jgi:hypothetical protein
MSNKRGHMSVGPDYRTVVRLIDNRGGKFASERSVRTAHQAIVDAERNCETAKARATIAAMRMQRR